MILYIDTSSAFCTLTLEDNGKETHHEWRAERQLARGLHDFMRQAFSERGVSWLDINGIGVKKGVGSFTGLRIGLTVMNTIANSLQIPIVGTVGDEWQSLASERLRRGDNDQLVVPEYGSAPHITKPRK